MQSDFAHVFIKVISIVNLSDYSYNGRRVVYYSAYYTFECKYY